MIHANSRDPMLKSGVKVFFVRFLLDGLKELAHSYTGWLKATFSDNYLKIMLLKIKLL